MRKIVERLKTLLRISGNKSIQRFIVSLTTYFAPVAMHIVTIKEIAPNSPVLSFEAEPEQKIFDDKRVFSGGIINEGVRRADFARIVFYLWDENTNLIASDSSFIDGTIVQYSSGIITDCALEPSQVANYTVSVSAPDTANVRYITKEIHFSIYE